VAASVLAIVFDCQDSYAVARFWSRVLGEDLVERDAGEYRVGRPTQGGPILYFMNVPEVKSVKNRVHIDVMTREPMVDEVTRLTALGATVVDVRADPDDRQNADRWTVMVDPEGNEFCVTSADLPGWFE
jgi:predicted enzyme related to lactoylglutathione lyase